MRPDGAINDRHPDNDLAFDLEMTRDEVAALEEIYNYHEKTQEVLSKRNQTFEDVGSVLFAIKDIHGFLGSRDRGFDPQVTRWIRDIAAKFANTINNLIFLLAGLIISVQGDM